MSEKISLIIPCKNEVESLGAVLNEVKNNEFVDEIIVVVDSTDDNSIPVINDFNCELIIQKGKDEIFLGQNMPNPELYNMLNKIFEK